MARGRGRGRGRGGRGRGRGRGGYGNDQSSEIAPAPTTGGAGVSNRGGAYRGRGGKKNAGRGGAGVAKNVVVNAGDEDINRQLTDMARFLTRRKELDRSKNEANALDNNFRQSFDRVMNVAVAANVVPKRTTVRTVLAAAGAKSELGIYRVMTTYTLDSVLTDLVKKGDIASIDSIGKVRAGSMYSELKAPKGELSSLVGMKYTDAKNRLVGRPTFFSDFYQTLSDPDDPATVTAVAAFVKKNGRFMTSDEKVAFFNYMVGHGSTAEQFAAYKFVESEQKRHREFLQYVQEMTMNGKMVGDIAFEHGSDFDSSFVTQYYDGMTSSEPVYSVYLSSITVGPDEFSVPTASRSFEDVVGQTAVFKNGLLFQKIGDSYYVAFPVGGPYMYVSKTAVQYWFAGDMQCMHDAFERISHFIIYMYLMNKIKVHYLMTANQAAPAIALPVDTDFSVVLDLDWEPRIDLDKAFNYFEAESKGVRHGFMMSDEVALRVGFKQGNYYDGTEVTPYPMELRDL